MICIRRDFLHMAGAALVLPAVSRSCNAQPSQGGPKLIQLLKADLERQGLMVQETVVNLLEMGPSASAPWHMHPGAQEIIFVLEGNLAVDVEGQGLMEVKAGGIALISAETPHLVRNDSALTTAKAVVTHSRAEKEKPFLVVLRKPS
jgi:mannose-6-phosphate isomerase-like protein (cupin superfamily)